MKTKFKVGQTVVHATHGVGKILNIETRDFGEGNIQTFYVVEIDDGGCPKKVLVPVQNADRLREVTGKADVPKILDVLASTPQVDRSMTWNRRYREYMEDIHSGELLRVARVFTALRALRDDGELSFGERKLMECAMSLIEKELTAAGVVVLMRGTK